MKTIKYFIQFIFIMTLLFIFKALGYKFASFLGSLIGKFFGPMFRSNKNILKNLDESLNSKSEKENKLIISNMWSNYGRILSEYIFLKNFNNGDMDKYIEINSKKTLEEICISKKPVIFISGHFNNFELMAMQIRKSNIKLAAIYRPLNNFFLNKIIEGIRKKYICKNQIKKGLAGTRELLKFFKDGHSIALMIDQRVTEGSRVNFFGRPAFTTTIPAQLIKKYGCLVVPIYIERHNSIYFKMAVDKPIRFEKDLSVDEITINLNQWLEEKISKNPDQWIWSHNRWK